MPTKSPGFAKQPDYGLELVPSPRRLRVEVAGEMIADSTHAMLSREYAHTPVYYFPKSDIRMDAMDRSDHTTHCPFKGDASYWTLKIGDRVEENFMWGYENPFEEMAVLADYRAFFWRQADHWYEEDEEVFVHARDPYRRVDTMPSSRKVEIILGGETVAETTRAVFLFETHTVVRYYIPKDDVRMDLLKATDSQTRCPYKGLASYWSATAGGQVYENIVWGYEDPIGECPKIKGLVSFYNEKVDAILVDGEETPKERPKIRWH